jgi:hypothetical protein
LFFEQGFSCVLLIASAFEKMDCFARARNDGAGAEDCGRHTLVLFADAEAAEDGV